MVFKPLAENSVQTMLTSNVNVLPRPSTERIAINTKYLEIQPPNCNASPTSSTQITAIWISLRSMAFHRSQ
ncbi:hypothetical protein CBL_13799 [Carabus blaptoides fortunei]